MTDALRVTTLYRFVRIEDPSSLRTLISKQLNSRGIRGIMLVAPEGINGTIAGSEDAVKAFLVWLRGDLRFADITHKDSYARQQPFQRTRVKLKKEIVTMGVEDIDPNNIVGTYVPPRKWNALISDPEVLVVDTRNRYEVEIGTFESAVNPGITSFRDFPRYLDREPGLRQDRRVAMFCTGGIRCEKSTAYLKTRGFDEVYHLAGGILKYLEEIPQTESLWRGECFVFDGRVSVNHSLEPGRFLQCHACRMPITEEDRQLASYRPGVSCRHCIDSRTDKQKRGSKERERQVRLALEKGGAHLGDDGRHYQEKQGRQKRAARHLR